MGCFCSAFRKWLDKSGNDNSSKTSFLIDPPSERSDSVVIITCSKPDVSVGSLTEAKHLPDNVATPSVVVISQADNRIQIATDVEHMPDDVPTSVIRISQSDDEVQTLTVGKHLPENIEPLQKKKRRKTKVQEKEPGKEEIKQQKIRLLDMLLLRSDLTDYWLEPEPHKVKTVLLNPDSEEAQSVFKIFDKTSRSGKFALIVSQIYRVQNIFQLGQYLSVWEEMKNRYGHVDELTVFHGTKKANVEGIVNGNFDWRRHGHHFGNRFGRGVSFSPCAMYASHYCDKEDTVKVMFLVKVLVSGATIGDKDMIIPGKYIDGSGKLQFYDTSIKENCSVIVKYSDNHFYPAYKIEYTNFQNR